MNQTVAIIGMGEMGGVFARGFLKAGFSVTPVRRFDDLHQIEQSLPQPELVLIAVGEKDLTATIEKIPQGWASQLALLQNELLPADWINAGLADPSIISVWFEKKPGQDFKVLVPSPVYGPKSGLITEALSTLNIPTYQVADDEELLFELVRKNLYILTTNICGLKTAGNVQKLAADHGDFMSKVFQDVLNIQQALTGHTFDRQALFNAVMDAFKGDPEHQCMGRSAPQRLQRALETAAQKRISVPALQEIAESL